MLFRSLKELAMGTDIADESDIRNAARYLMSEGPPLYYWGHPASETIRTGSLSTMLVEGADCSGCTLTMAVFAGLCDGDWALAHRSTSLLIPALTEVPVGEQRPGDVACYSGHVAMVVDWPGDDGHSWCLSMSGGNSSVKGDNPSACGKIVKGNYMNTFTKYGRFPAQGAT